MRKLILIVVSLFLMVLNPSVALATPEKVQVISNVSEERRVDRTGVVLRSTTLRQEPSNSSNGIGNRLPANTNIRISARQGNWYRVRVGELMGWIRRNRVVQTRQTAVVRGQLGHLYSVRNSNFSNLLDGNVESGTLFTITERRGRWSRVTVNAQRGWMESGIWELNVSGGRRPGHTRNQVNLHSRPCATSSVRRRLPRNQEFMILQRTRGGSGPHNGWTQVEIRHQGGTQRGWVRTSQVRRGNQTRRSTNRFFLYAAATADISPVPEMLTHPIHYPPSINPPQFLPTGSSVRVLAESGNWSYVRIQFRGQNVYGWTRNAYLTTIIRLPQP